MPPADPIPAPLDRHREIVRPEWIDYNGHMNMGHFIMVFDRATDTMMDYLGLDAAYRATTSCSLFVVELHIVYAAELKSGDPLRVTTQVLGHDDKRVHFFHRMLDARTDSPAAATEMLGLHVNLSSRRAAPFPAEVLARVAGLAGAHARLPPPAEAGRTVALRRKP
ncbi:MAG: thioesterase family protein [Pseudomonadota bacterium]